VRRLEGQFDPEVGMVGAVHFLGKNNRQHEPASLPRQRRDHRYKFQPSRRVDGRSG